MQKSIIKIGVLVGVVMLIILFFGFLRKKKGLDLPSGANNPASLSLPKRGQKRDIPRPADHEFFLQVDGLERKYLVHVPAQYDRKAGASLVLMLHGGMGNADLMAKEYGWVEKSDNEGFIVAFLNGPSKFPSGKFATWNAGNCCGYARDNNIDDVAYVDAVVKDLQDKFVIEKVFAAGMSNGGMMAYRLACDMPATFTAIAAVAGTENYGDCHPDKPVSIMHIHARDDDRVLFNGGAGQAFRDETKVTEFSSVPETISRWVTRNTCAGTPKRVKQEAGVYCDLYTGCAEDVQIKLCVTETGGHSWPGFHNDEIENSLESGTPSTTISANDEIWEFFKAQQ